MRRIAKNNQILPVELARAERRADGRWLIANGYSLMANSKIANGKMAELRIYRLSAISE